MTIAPRMKSFLDGTHIPYALVPHARAHSARSAADAAHVPPEWLAKAVLLSDYQGYLLAVVPAARRLALERVADDLGRRLDFARERELSAIFSDCASAAIPPFGDAYGIPTVVDEALLDLTDVYLEAGDDESLVRMGGSDFAMLCAGRPRGAYSVPVERLSATTGPARHEGERDRSLVDGLTHVFSLRSFGARLRGQAEYERNGHAGMLLLKTPELRVVLEAMRPDTVLSAHIAHGPTTLLVLEGGLDVRTPHGTFHVGESHMATLPHDERREIRAPVESLFLLALGRLAHAEDRWPPAKVTRTSCRRRILIVANQTAAGAHLLEAVRARLAAGPCEFVVLVPAISRWMDEEEAGLGRVHPALDTACAGLRELGASVRGSVGDFYPLRAIQDLWLEEEEGFDEILLSTFPAAASEWLELDLPTAIAQRFGVRVSQVQAGD